MNYSIQQWIILLILFIPMSVLDIKSRRISLWFVACVGIAGILNTALFDMPQFIESITRVLPGIVLLIVAYLTKECIGKGDGIICIVLGTIIQANYVLLSIFSGFIFSAVFGLLYILIKKVSGKTKLPFIPFLFGGVVLCGII